MCVLGTWRTSGNPDQKAWRSEGACSTDGSKGVRLAHSAEIKIQLYRSESITSIKSHRHTYHKCLSSGAYVHLPLHHCSPLRLCHAEQFRVALNLPLHAGNRGNRPMTVKDVAVWGPPCYALATELSIALVRLEGERTPAVRPNRPVLLLRRTAAEALCWAPNRLVASFRRSHRVDRRVKLLPRVSRVDSSEHSSSIGPKEKQFEGPEMVQKNGP